MKQIFMCVLGRLLQLIGLVSWIKAIGESYLYFNGVLNRLSVWSILILAIVAFFDIIIGAYIEFSNEGEKY